MEAYRHILINVHGGSSFQFSTASVGTSVSEVAANMHTQSGGKPDPAMHVHQTVGVPNSGGVQWAAQHHYGDPVDGVTNLVVVGVWAYGFFKGL